MYRGVCVGSRVVIVRVLRLVSVFKREKKSPKRQRTNIPDVLKRKTLQYRERIVK